MKKLGEGSYAKVDKLQENVEWIENLFFILENISQRIVRVWSLIYS